MTRATRIVVGFLSAALALLAAYQGETAPVYLFGVLVGYHWARLTDQP